MRCRSNILISEIFRKSGDADFSTTTVVYRPEARIEAGRSSRLDRSNVKIFASVLETTAGAKNYWRMQATPLDAFSRILGVENPFMLAYVNSTTITSLGRSFAWTCSRTCMIDHSGYWLRELRIQACANSMKANQVGLLYKGRASGGSTKGDIAMTDKARSLFARKSKTRDVHFPRPF